MQRKQLCARKMLEMSQYCIESPNDVSKNIYRNCGVCDICGIPVVCKCLKSRHDSTKIVWVAAIHVEIKPIQRNPINIRSIFGHIHHKICTANACISLMIGPLISCRVFFVFFFSFVIYEDLSKHWIIWTIASKSCGKNR